MKLQPPFILNGLASVVLGLLMALAFRSGAADVTLTAGDAAGTTSFNQAGHWDSLAAPTAGNSYFTGAFGLRTPVTGTAITFQGDSLSVDTGGLLLLKGTASRTVTINNLILNGGGLGNGDNFTFTIAGGISVTAPSHIFGNDGGRTINITAPITGTAGLTIGNSDTASTGNTSTTNLAGNNSGYSGPITLANDFNSLTYNSILNINHASALGTGTLTINSVGVTLGNNTAGAITLVTNNPQVWNADFGFGTTSDLNMGTGAISLGTAAGTSRTVTVTNSQLTLGGVISNGTTANALVKSGAGVLTLTGANAYTGGTTITGGTLRIETDAALGATPGAFSATNISLSGGGILKNNSASLTLGANRGITLGTGGGGIEVRGGTTLTVPGAIAGTTGITKADTGTLALSGTNTFSGGIVVNAGTVSASAVANLNANAVTVNVNGTLSVNTGATAGNPTFSSAISGAGIVNVANTAQANYTGNWSGFTGTLNVNTTTGGKMFFSGTAPAAAATIVVANGATFYAGATTFANKFTVTGTGNTENRGAIRLDGGTISGNITLAGNSTFGNSGTNVAATFSGVISGAFGIAGAANTGAGTSIVLSGPNTYTGVSSINKLFRVTTLSNYDVAGALGARTLAQETATGDGIGIAFRGGTLQYTGATAQSTDRQIRISTAGGIIDASGSVPAATVSFTKTGANINLFETAGARTLTLTGTNTGANTFAIRLTDQDAATGKTSLAKTGTGKWVLTSADSTFSGGVNISVGELWITTGAALGAGTKTITLSNGTAGNPQLHLDGSAGDITLPAFTYMTSNTSSATSASIVNQAGNNTVNGNFTMTSGGGGTRLLSNAGKITFTGNFTPDTTGRTLDLRGAGDGEIQGVIANGSTVGLPVTKSGSGTWTLSGANTYTGTTRVTEGRLYLNGATPAAGLIDVSALATLAGGGSGGDTTLVDTAVLSPGNAAFNNNDLQLASLTLTTGSVLNYELGAPNDDPVTTLNDLVRVGGILTLGGVLNVSARPGFTSAVAGDRWVLMTFPSGNLVDAGTTLGTTPALSPGLSLLIEPDSANGAVFLTVVPEPAAGILLALGLLLVWFRKRVHARP